jgi:hypothetical protein
VQAVSWLGADFGPAFANAGSAIRDAAMFIAPFAEGLAKIAGGAVVGSLLAIAKAMEFTTGILREHSGIVQALATVGLVLLVGRLAQAGAAFLSMAADAAAFRAFEFAGAIDGIIGALGAMRVAFVAARAEGAGFAAATSAAMATLSLSTAAIATGGLVALGLVLYGVQTKLNDGARAAQEFHKQITMRFDQSSIKGLTSSLEETRAKMDEVGKTGSTITDRLNIPKMIEAEGQYNDLKQQVDDYGKAVENRTKSVTDMATALAAQHGPSLQNAADIQVIATQMDAIASKEKIDPTDHDAQQHLMDLTSAAMFSLAPMAALHDAFMSVAAAGSSADDALKAYQTALQSLFGVHIAAQQAENAFAASLDEVHGKVAGGINLLDAYNASSRAGRDAVLGSADAAMKHAVSIYEETGSLESANGALQQHIGQLINTMVSTGMSRAAAEAYIATLHLTPDNIKTLATLNKAEAEGAAKALDAQYNLTARDRYTTMHVEVAAAMANLNSLQAKLDYVGAKARSGDLAAAGYAAGRALAGNARGGITLHQYAGGGIESHLATVAPAGAMRLWAEPETGGEAYIPLSLTKRNRSVQVLSAVAQMFGFQLMRYAQGGMTVSASGTGQSSIVMAPGSVQVSVVNPGSGLDVQRAVSQAMTQWSRQMRTELRTRGRSPAGGLR